MNRHTVILVAAVLAAPAAASASAVHVDARDYPAAGAGRVAFEQMERALVRGFDNICGDTFCEGEYSNLRALQLRCAVKRDDGTVTGCLWSFAGSYADVARNDPVPEVNARTYACALPVVAGTPLSWMLTELSGEEAVDTPLPGSGRTSYEALTDCL